MSHLTHIQAPVTSATVLRHSKALGWPSTEVDVPASTDYTTTKYTVLAAAHALMGACCHCTAAATDIALLSARGIASDQQTARRFFILVDHCSAPECTRAAATLGNACIKEIAAGTDLGTHYVCSACKKTAPNMLRCTGCQLTCYCNATCQRADRAQHKPYCHAKE